MSAQFDKLADGERIELFREIGSQDFLHFNFGRSYAKQIEEAVAKTGKFCAITVHLRVLKVMLVTDLYHISIKIIKKIALILFRAYEILLN